MPFLFFVSSILKLILLCFAYQLNYFRNIIGLFNGVFLNVRQVCYRCQVVSLLVLIHQQLILISFINSRLIGNHRCSLIGGYRVSVLLIYGGLSWSSHHLFGFVKFGGLRRCTFHVFNPRFLHILNQLRRLPYLVHILTLLAAIEAW